MKGIRKLSAFLRPFIAGAATYWFRPALRSSWGGPFNGQQHRQKMFVEILKSMGAGVILETGTFRGTTTEYMARESKIPVWTFESSREYYAYSLTRLWRFPNVKLRCVDSRRGLRGYFDGSPTSELACFCYLDAHWQDDLPLADELEIIFGSTDNAVVMVDDFCVPNDAGYGYDDYGPGRALVRQYVNGVVEKYRLTVFYPSLDSHQETGARRGCIVLAPMRFAARLAAVPSIRIEQS